MTPTRVWKFLEAHVALRRKLNARGERIYRALIRRNKRRAEKR